MMSGRIAFSVIAVSISVSPFFTLELPTAMFMTSAPRRLPASLERGLRARRGLEEQIDLRAPAQGRALLLDLPRNARPPRRRGRAALSISGRVRPSMPSRWRREKAGGESGAVIKAAAYRSCRGGRQEARAGERRRASRAGAPQGLGRFLSVLHTCSGNCLNAVTSRTCFVAWSNRPSRQAQA